MKKNSHLVLLAFVLSLLILTACSCGSTSSKITRKFEGCLVPYTLEELCKNKEIIVRGTIAKYNKCVDVENSVRTYITVNVTELIKGDAKYASSVETWFMGGETKKQICMPISGTLPQIGEEHIFFISSANGKYYPLFQIKDNQILLDDFFESKLYKKELVSGTGDNRQWVSADALVAEIKEIVAAQANTAKQ